MILFVAILMLVLSAMFSGSEIAFVSASKLKVELKKKSASLRGRMVEKFYADPAQFIGSLLVGNNVVLVIFTYLMSLMLRPVLEHYVHNEFTIFVLTTLLVTIVVLIFGEFLPKTVFRQMADRLLFALAIPLRLTQVLFWLPAKLMNSITTFVLRHILKVPERREMEIFTRSDLEYLIRFGNKDGEDESVQQEMFENALSLQDVKVREIMVPRTEVVYIDKDASIEALVRLFKESGFSRIVVVKESLDDVVGYVHHIKLMESAQTVEEITLPIIIVPETLRVHDLLNRFIARKQSIACVVDEFGSVSGIVTMEDVLEEIFGEIADEHDEIEAMMQQISDREYLFTGRVEVDKINKHFEQIKIPEGDYNTLSGYIVTTIHRIPEQGEIIELNGYRFIIEQVSDKKIEKVRLLVVDEEPED